MRRWVPVLVQGGLLTVALALAYFSWTDDRQPPLLAAEVWQLGPAPASEVRLAGPGRTVVLTHRPADGATAEPLVWATVTEPAPVQPPAPAAELRQEPGSLAGSGAAAGLGEATGRGAGAGSGATAGSPTPAATAAVPPPSSPTPSTLQHDFRCNARALEVLGELVRLRARRDLGVMPAGELAPLGLATPGETLTVTAAGGTRRLGLGGEVFGTGQRYVREEASGRVFVMDQRLLQDVSQAAVRLLDKELHGHPAEGVDRVVVRPAGAQPRTLLRLGKGRDWAAAATPTVADPQAAAWLGKLGRLRVVTYLPADGPPPTPLVELQLFAGDKQVGFLELGSQAQSEGQPRYVARSERTVGRRVEVTPFLADEAARDLAGMFPPPAAE